MRPSPSLEIRSDVEQPFWFIRTQSPVIDQNGRLTKKRKVHFLGHLSDTPRSAAEKARVAILDNLPLQRQSPTSEFRFADLVKRYYELRLPQLSFGSQLRYRSQIDKHLLPQLGHMRLSDIDDLAVERLIAAKIALIVRACLASMLW